MTPENFFKSKKVKVGSKIQYGDPNWPAVRVTFIARGSMYAYGVEEGTERQLVLILSSGLLKDPVRGGSHGCIKIVR